MLMLSSIHGWHTQQIDYVQDFPQASIEKPLYIKIPKGFEIAGGNTKDHVLKLKKNIYGQKQAGRVWNH